MGDVSDVGGLGNGGCLAVGSISVHSSVAEGEPGTSDDLGGSGGEKAVLLSDGSGAAVCCC